MWEEGGKKLSASRRSIIKIIIIINHLGSASYLLTIVTIQVLVLDPRPLGMSPYPFAQDEKGSRVVLKTCFR